MDLLHLSGNLAVRLLHGHVRSLLAEDHLLCHERQHVRVELLDQGVRIELGSKLFIIVSEDSVIEI